MAQLSIKSGVTGYYHATLGTGRSAVVQRFKLCKGKDSQMIISALVQGVNESRGVKNKWYKVATYKGKSALVMVNSKSYSLWHLWLNDPNVDWQIVNVDVPLLWKINGLRTKPAMKKRPRRRD